MEKVKVLIVDNNQEMRDKLSGLVAEMDELVLAGVAADGLMAIALYEREKPSLVFTDILLPQMNGFGMLEYFSRQEQRPEVIVLSALTQERFIHHALTLGTRYYIPKPFDGRLLQSRVRDLLAAKKFSSMHPAARKRSSAAFVRQHIRPH